MAKKIVTTFGRDGFRKLETTVHFRITKFMRNEVALVALKILKIASPVLNL